MIQEFHDGIKKYWFFFVMKLGLTMSGYFSITDVNLGMDVSGRFVWITSAGRDFLIYNSSEQTDEEKSMLLTNTSLI